MRGVLFALLVVCVLSALGCDRGKKAPELPLGTWTEDERALIESLSPVPPLPASPGNKVADDPKARALGHKLFFDKRLSVNGEVSCATCHQPENYFTDGLELAKGVGTAKRHTPSVIGSQWSPFVFWDGRKDSLWAQALGPVENAVEHGFNRVAMAHVIHKHYKAEYEALFGAMPDLSESDRFPANGRPIEFMTRHPHNVAWSSMLEVDRTSINAIVANAGKAIEAYERMLVPGEAAFDRYVAALKAGDKSGGGHLSESAMRGLRDFVGRGQCVNCHNGPLLSDQGFHNLGLPIEAGGNSADIGRSLGAAEAKMDTFRCGGDFSDAEDCPEIRHLNPTFEDFLGAFKTPSLRNVARTAPYMHSGQFAELSDVINFYRTLPGKASIGHRELVLDLLDGSVDTKDLVAFLESLTGPLPPAQWLKVPGQEL